MEQHFTLTERRAAATSPAIEPPSARPSTSLCGADASRRFTEAALHRTEAGLHRADAGLRRADAGLRRASVGRRCAGVGRRSAEAGQALTEYALLATVLVASVWVAAGPLGLLAAFRRYFGSIHFVLSLPLP